MASKSIRSLAVCSFCLLLGLAGAQEDRTREEGAKGSAVVEAVLAELHDSCIYPEDDLFLRRVAFVETGDGTDPATYTTPNFNGGIWKVDETMFQRTKAEISSLSAQYNMIRSKLGIDWSTVTWADLRKPLYSALGAALFLNLQGGPANIPSPEIMQATYWLTHYHISQSGYTLQNFTEPVKSLGRACARTEDMDLVFLVDTSSSVSSTDWSAINTFITNIIISLTLHNGIGPDKDRVAMVTFSDQARLSFGFDVGSNLQAALAQVKIAPRAQGGSNISAALNVAETQVFRSARPDAIKVAVLITNGRDNDPITMVTNLVAMRMSDVTIFTVAVGSDVSKEQMQEIASAPTCSHSYYVDSYLQLENLRMAVERISCRVPFVLSPGQYTYPCGFNVLAQVQGESLGTAITVTTSSGRVDIWASYNTQLPSEEANNFNVTATRENPAVFSTLDPRPLTFSLESEKLQSLTCNGNFTVRVDRLAPPRTECNQRKPDLVFLVDSTLVTSDEAWKAVLNFVQSFSQQFDVSSAEAHVALVSYGSKQTIHFRLGQHGSTSDFLQALRTIARPEDGVPSNLPVALSFVSTQVFSSGSRGDASKTLVLITPGILSDPSSTVPVAEFLHAMGTRIVIVSVGSAFDNATISAIASGPQHVKAVPDLASLTEVVGTVVEEACGDVTILCVEGGINRECHIEDLLSSQYGNLLGPDPSLLATSPCLLQMASGSSGLHLDRFPHPTDKDKFLLCDSTGQTYVVLCPLGENYLPSKHECAAVDTPITSGPQPSQPSVTQPPQTTSTTQVITTQRILLQPTPPRVSSGNPCTADRIINQEFYLPYLEDKTKYYQCTEVPLVGSLQTCPHGKVWNQNILSCVFAAVIVDAATEQTDPNIPNPCDGSGNYFPSPTDSNSFIQCDEWHEAYLKHCQPGDVWRQALEACDNP